MAEGKQKCKYWEKCYRKDKTHKQKFFHPGDILDAGTSAKGKSTVDLTGKKVVFTGTLSGGTRKQAEAKAIDAGCQVIKAISSKTHYLVCGEEPGGKLTYAENLGNSCYYLKTLLKPIQ